MGVGTPVYRQETSLWGDGALQLTALQVETGAWRSFLTRHGTTTILKPDLFATLSTRCTAS